MRKVYQHIFKINFIILISIFSQSAFSLTSEEIVFNTTQEVLDRLKADKERLKKEPEYIQVIVRELIIPNMDFIKMSRLVIGDKWLVLTEEEKECFSQGFKNLLVERYAYILLSYRNQDISYQSARPFGNEGYVSIMQTLTRPEVKPLRIEYPMRPEGESWKVVDLVIDGVSLIRNYRKMFGKEIKQQGLQGFINSFHECNS